MNVNQNTPRNAMRKISISTEHCQKQLDFMNIYRPEIMMCWIANKDKQGYIEVFITPDYKPYECGFRFVEKRVKKSTFNIILPTYDNIYALIHFHWEATYSQYRMAYAFDKYYA